MTGGKIQAFFLCGKRATLRALVFGVAVGAAATLFFFSLTTGADVGSIRPNDNGSVSGTPTGCGAGGIYDCLDDVVTQPTAPSTGSDYVTWVNNDFSFFLMQPISDVATVSSITVWLYHAEGGTNAAHTVGIYAANEATSYGGPTNVTTRTSAQWDSVTFNSLALSQTQLDDLRVRVECTKTGGGTSNTCRSYAMYATVTYTKQIEVNVSANGTQQNVNGDSTDQYIGGAFAVSELISARNITSVTLTETGSVDAQTGLDNIRLYYELDTSSPYNCASESYAGTEFQFGNTDTDGFSAPDGISVFSTTTGPTITTTATLCLYVVTDVLPSAISGETIDIQISDPSTQVIATGGVDVRPTTTVAITGQSTIVAPFVEQTHYHWRNDDGNENDPGGATSAIGTSNGYDSTYDTLGKETPTRLRLQVSNEGNASSDPMQYRLEYGRKITFCSNVSTDSSWHDVDTAGGDWEMFDTSNLTNGNDTTDIAESIGGMPNPAGKTFLTPNGAVRDTTSQTGNITLTSSQFVEIEYAIEATASSTEGFIYCFRLTDAGSTLDDYGVYPEATILADVNVTTNGTQRATVDIPTTDVDAGADFVFTDNIAGNTTIQSIVIAASGTVDYANDIDNLELWYDTDTTGGDGYNCSDESFDGDELQYGTTASGFSATGTRKFSEDVTINTSESLCLYVVYDVTSGAGNDETLDIKINDPSTDVVVDSGTVSPAAQLPLSGTTVFVTTDLSIVHYHWRDDDGDEDDATSATGGAEDTLLANLRQQQTKRLRFGVSNEGSSSTPAYSFRLEFAPKTSVCSAATGWTDVGAADGAFDMSDSVNIPSDGLDTTNISTAIGGVSDVGDTYITNNNGLKDTSSQVSAFAFSGKEYTDLEFAIEATASSTEGATYCFRLTDAGTPFSSDVYEVYPEVDIKPQTDFFIQRGTLDIQAGATTATINAGTEYVAPVASTTAFIRITNTNNSGAGGGATGNADDVTVYVSNPWNIENNITFQRPAGATGDTRVAWEIIEYVGAPGGDNEIAVRHQAAATYGTGNTTVSSPTVGGVVDDTDVVVFVTGQLNPDTTTNYPSGLSTAAWNAGSDIATFTRGVSGNAAGVSYAVVEFVGENWTIQRSEHTYTAAGATEFDNTINPVNSTARAFIHTQKRMGSGLNTHGDYGHQVWLSGMMQVSYVLDGTAGTPGSHTSVAWIIENTQAIGNSMVVTRSNGTQSGGTAPATVNANIGTTIGDIQDASLFINNYGDEPGGGGGQNSFPEPMLSATLISTTQYQIWIADTSDSRAWRAEVVEWPTAARNIEQNYYQFYEDDDSLNPANPWPCEGGPCGENTAVTGLDNPIANGEVMRVRMTLRISAAAMTAGLDTFALQYGEMTSSCTAISEDDWHDVGEIGSTTAFWRGYDATPADGTALSTDPPTGGDLKITSVADIAGTYEEENPSVVTPYDVDPGEDVEFDWVVQNNNAPEKTDFCFRMREANEIVFDAYHNYPQMRTAGYGAQSQMWQWYDDAENETPTTPLAATNTAPVDIAFEDTVQLRLTLREVNGADETNAKFRLQYSSSSDFSSFEYLDSISECVDGQSLWCYGDGGGVDNATVTTALLEDVDACSTGTGNGCGSHNEHPTSTSQFTHYAGAATEFAFTIRHAGARVNKVYYFRVYDEANDLDVPLGVGESYPSLATEGADVVLTLSAIASSTTIGDVTTDIDTTPVSVPFGELPINSDVVGAQRIVVDTNGTEGYQVFVYATSHLMEDGGEIIEYIAASNTSPEAWSTACESDAVSCFGYHTTDVTLSGGSSRFAANDTYAAFEGTMREVAYSTGPVSNDVVDVVYRVSISEVQPPGEYQTQLVYIIVPIF